MLTTLNLARNPKTIPKSIAPNTVIVTGMMDANVTSLSEPIRIEDGNQYGRDGLRKDETEDKEIERASKVSSLMDRSFIFFYNFVFRK